MARLRKCRKNMKIPFRSDRDSASGMVLPAIANMYTFTTKYVTCLNSRGSAVIKRFLDLYISYTVVFITL